MRKLVAGTTIAFVLLLIATPVFAVKPDKGAEFIDWNLSAEVMPVPPYGSLDIPGSDAASKLIVNQPNGNTEVTITGAMNGLHPNTEYTVYLSKGYEPYVYTGWNVEGDWVIRVLYGSGEYFHDYTINVQSDGTFSGTGGYPAGGPYTITETITGTIDVMTGAITYHSVYNNGYYYDTVGAIASDGTMSGDWESSTAQQGTWSSTSGFAVETHTGDASWPGLFTSTVQPFTFTSDAFGAGSWHINLRDENFPGPGDYDLSVWINESGRTILISDTFSVSVD